MTTDQPATPAGRLTLRTLLALRKFGVKPTVGSTGESLLIGIADKTSATGYRTFVIEVREIDPPEDGVITVTVPARDGRPTLAEQIADAVSRRGL